MNLPDTAEPQFTRAGPATPEMTLVDEFDHWLQRVSATHGAVLFTCTSRLRGDRAAASQVAVQVMAGLLARPSIFRYFGLPYSGRIARLAENLLAQAKAGTLATVCSWHDLYALLERLPPQHRDVLVLTCVRGVDNSALADHLGSTHEFATHRYNAMLTHMRRLAAPGSSPNGDPDTVTKE
jgi:DNA-directed RNA polymerase specialized sigma24 family protein